MLPTRRKAEIGNHLRKIIAISKVLMARELMYNGIHKNRLRKLLKISIYKLIAVKYNMFI